MDIDTHRRFGMIIGLLIVIIVTMSILFFVQLRLLKKNITNTDINKFQYCTLQENLLN